MVRTPVKGTIKQSVELDLAALHGAFHTMPTPFQMDDERQYGPAGAFAQEYTLMRNPLYGNKLYGHEKASQ